jgi:transcriptional regulator of acetoin/glycerol metabolism
MGTPPSPRLEQIALARQSVLEEGAGATDALVQAWFDRTWAERGWIERGWIERSWRRCLAAGQRPGQTVLFAPVSPAAQRRTAQAAERLQSAARPELERLARAVAPIRYFAILTDAHGTVVDTAGAIDARDRHASSIARVGVDLSERSIGTSAIGAALSELQPVWLHRGEHFFQATSVYSCAGAPLLGPTGQCQGMLDLTGVEVPERPELRHLVARAARAIENALVLAEPHALRLHLAWAESLPGEGGDALLCLDADGRVVAANGAARQMLPGLSVLAHAPVHAEELFALPWPELFDAACAREPRPVPLWSGLRVALQASRPDGQAPAGARPSLKALESELIHQAVRDAGGNVAEAARALGLSRATVYRRLGGPRGAAR